MDKYDEKARELVSDPWGAPVADDVVDLIAQALREAAADGMEQAADFCGSHEDYSPEGIALMLREKVRALRSTAAKESL